MPISEQNLAKKLNESHDESNLTKIFDYDL